MDEFRVGVRRSTYRLPLFSSPSGLLTISILRRRLTTSGYVFSGVGGVRFFLFLPELLALGVVAWNWSIVLGFTRQFFATGLPLQLSG